MAATAAYEQFDALGLADLIARREVTALEILDEALERSEQRNPALNAITVKFYDRARQAAMRPLPNGPFAGVPFLLKDLGASLAGTISTESNKILATRVADRSSTIVERHLAAGLNIFGRTATSEFGLATSTEPAMFGACRNPWDLGRSAGGSSGGAAACVAARIVPMAHATDGGGSIRIPASACGVFGLKPTRARNPSGPEVGEGWGSQTVGHCVSISVRDSAALLDATSGPAMGDPYWAPPAAGSFLEEVGRPPRPLRIALCTSPWNGMPVDPDCVQAAEDAATLCESMGHHVTPARPEFDFPPFREAQRILIAANVAALLASLGEVAGRPLDQEDVEARTWGVAVAGRGYSAAQYVEAMARIHRVGRTVAGFFTGFDILLTATLCTVPLPLGVVSPENPNTDSYLAGINSTIGFTALFNASGNPAMSVPLHWTPSGLPVGVQFVAPFGDEATLFRLAAQLEIAKPWRDRRPPMIA
jgi:amidase/6-aminohexanoate-cyclic-dimer hydrolase